MQVSALTILGTFCTPVSSLESVLSLTTCFDFSCCTESACVGCSLTQLDKPIPIKIRVSNIMIFLSMSLLTAIFTTGRCMYLTCVYDWDFWKPSAILPLLGPFLITYFCVPLAPVFTSVRRCLCSCFSLDALCCFAIASVIAFESLIILLYKIFMHCQQG